MKKPKTQVNTACFKTRELHTLAAQRWASQLAHEQNLQHEIGEGNAGARTRVLVSQRDLVFLSEFDGPGLFVHFLLTGADGKMRGPRRGIPLQKKK